VRESEEVEKKGWFSRSKPRTPNSTPTSYPPSVSSVGRPTQKPEQRPGDDGDLPPREANASDAPTSTVYPSGTSHDEPSDVADDISSELPPGAGFDLAAMRAVIEGIQGGPRNQDDVDGMERLEFAPPLRPQDTATTQLRATSPPVMAPENSTARTLSLGKIGNAQPVWFEGATEDANEDYTSRTPSPATFSSRSPAIPAAPTLSLRSDDGESWAPEVPDKDILGSFAGPVGNPFRSTPIAAAGPSASTSNTSDASLAAPLSERDPWSLQKYPGDVSANASAKASVFAAVNPWES
jgi:hypothetical protein